MASQSFTVRQACGGLSELIVPPCLAVQLMRNHTFLQLICICLGTCTYDHVCFQLVRVAKPERSDIELASVVCSQRYCPCLFLPVEAAKEIFREALALFGGRWSYLEFTVSTDTAFQVLRAEPEAESQVRLSILFNSVQFCSSLVSGLGARAFPGVIPAPCMHS